MNEHGAHQAITVHEPSNVRVTFDDESGHLVFIDLNVEAQGSVTISVEDWPVISRRINCHLSQLNRNAATSRK